MNFLFLKAHKTIGLQTDKRTHIYVKMFCAYIARNTPVDIDF